MSDVETISLSEAETLMTTALSKSGVPEAVARSVARALVAAEAEGQVGHGFSRLEDYVSQVRAGKIRADAEVRVEETGPAARLVDAGCGFAYPALDVAVEAAREVAMAQGVAAVSVFNSHHCGALSVQVDKLAREGLLALMVANTPKAMAPWGAAAPYFGTNPIAFAAPRTGEAPLVIDLSLSKVARGKVMHAKKSGTAIPEGWALDVDGQPTTDPEAALNGSMLPIGEAKGAALALIVEVLASALTGGTRSAAASSFLSAHGKPPAVGQFLLAISPGAGAEGFAARLEVILQEIAAMDGARLPGTRRLEAMARAEMEGLQVPVGYLDGARRLAGLL